MSCPASSRRAQEHSALALEIALQVGDVDDLVLDVEVHFFAEKVGEVLMDEVIGGLPPGEVAHPLGEISDGWFAVALDLLLIHNLAQGVGQSRFRTRSNHGIKRIGEQFFLKFVAGDFLGFGGFAVLAIAVFGGSVAVITRRAVFLDRRAFQLLLNGQSVVEADGEGAAGGVPLRFV